MELAKELFISEKFPKVSVIMSNYNTRENFLRESIESILSQTFDDFELIIIDDKSEIESLDIIKSYNDKRIRLLRNSQNLGLAASLNKGIQISRGEYIARMDTDDISLPRRLEKQVLFLNKNKDVQILGCRAKLFGDVKGIREMYPNNSKEIMVQLLFNVGLTHPTIIMRKSFLLKYQLFYNEKFKKSQDYELWVRCSLLGKIYELPEILLKYRVSSTQASSVDRSEQNNLARNVRINILNKLGIFPTKREYLLHYSLSKTLKDDTFSVLEIWEWCEKLINSNKKHHKYDQKLFENVIMKYWIVFFLRFYLSNNKNIDNQKKKLIIKKTFSPKYYHAYFQRFVRSFHSLINKI